MKKKKNDVLHFHLNYGSISSICQRLIKTFRIDFRNETSGHDVCVHSFW